MRLWQLRKTGALAAVVLLFTPGASAAAGRPVAFQAADGVSLAGMYYEASQRPASAVVLVHMLGRSKDEWIPFAERLQDDGVTSLAFDLRGHGHSAGNGSELPLMVGDVQAAIRWLSGRPAGRATSIALVGASLGANLAVLAAADEPGVRALALLSPSLDYRGLRLESALVRKITNRSVWLAASTEDPYALRTVKDLATENASFQQHLSTVRGHGTPLLAADSDLSRALVDWLKATLIS
jgi:alpha-beta hydrolase superfamily lysophospholipase